MKHAATDAENRISGALFQHFRKFYYGLGMKMYDWIYGKSSLLPSRLLTRDEALSRMPAMQPPAGNIAKRRNTLPAFHV